MKCLMTYLLMDASSQSTDNMFNEGTMEVHSSPMSLVVTNIKQGNKSCYVRYWNEMNITCGVEKTKEKNIARGELVFIQTL